MIDSDFTPKMTRKGQTNGSPQPPKSGRNRLAVILLAVGAAAVLAITLFFALHCNHQWAEATCQTPRTCMLCEKTEGEPLSHQWKAATCLYPKICRLCGMEEGEPLPHTPGDEETVCQSLIDRSVVHTRKCTQCGIVAVEETEIVDSFLLDGQFIFSDEQFIERFLYLTDQAGLDFSVEAYYPDSSADGSNIIRNCYTVYLDGEDWGNLQFDYSSKDDSVPDVVHGSVYFLNNTEYTSLINYTILGYLIMSADPTVSVEDSLLMLQELDAQIRGNFTEENYGDINAMFSSGMGSCTCNGITYEQIGSDIPGLMSIIAMNIRPASQGISE